MNCAKVWRNAICLSLSSVTGLIDRLVEKRLVRRDRSNEDRRQVQVELTAEGRQLHEAALESHLEFADKLLKAEHPMLLAEYAGRRPGGFENLVALAETTGAAVWDVNNALNFPNKHPLCLSMDTQSLRHTDLIMGLDVKDWEKQLTELDNAKRTREAITPAACDFVEIGFGEINISKWAMDYCRMQPCSIRALGDTALGIPELTRICKQRIDSNARLAGRIAERKIAIAKRHSMRNPE